MKTAFRNMHFFTVIMNRFLSIILYSSSTVVLASNVSEPLIAKINKTVNSDTARLQSIFKDIHANPELAFMETRTAGIIAKQLQLLGFSVKTGIGKTGVVGIMENGNGPTVMFRADMDANAVEEATGLPYASKVRVTTENGKSVPVAHMCGHDAHLTWLLSLAKTMSELRNEWRGTLVLVAQPAEEPIEGAAAMVKDGLYTRFKVPKPDYFFAMHSTPLATGSVVASSGVLTSGSEHVDVTFHGIGGHGSSPQLTKDPVIMASTAVLQYQTIVSRLIDPLKLAVLTVGSIQAGVDNNVIPTEAKLKIKLHFYEPEVGEQLVSNIENISKGIANSYGVPEEQWPTINRKGRTSPVVNSQGFIGRIQKVLSRSDFISETDIIKSIEPARGSEDAHLLVKPVENIEVAYLWIGSADPKLVAQARNEGKEFPFFPHNPDYRVDLKTLAYGGKVASLVAMDLLRRQ